MTKVKYAILAIYGVLGMLGWYNYYYHSMVTSASQIDQLSASLTSSYVRSIVWYHSRGKLQELRSIILNDDLSQEEKIETRISNMLKHRTSAYIRILNSLNAPIDNLGNWYAEHFAFNPFLEEVYQITFNKNLDVNEKLRDVADVMEKYQNATNQLLDKELGKFSEEQSL